ncbi:MAG: Plug domain-containing protein, partial [Muribaculaceae bacterium]|nr:Plug domain-containing protein [Muribaculaceae bacterium]
MKILAVFIAALSLPAALSAQEQLREVVVSAARPIAKTGLHTSPIDSAALKENIAMSMADVLGYNSSIFVKSYGRATLSTVSFRGTSASHTQVTWNGMPITNPMQGMTDFSTIPSYFIDRATVVHGNSSLGEGEGGGLGGLVSLASAPVEPDGLKIQYVQGIGSFGTFDEFARISYGAEHWRSSTRVVYSSSRNDYTYIN